MTYLKFWDRLSELRQVTFSVYSDSSSSSGWKGKGFGVIEVIKKSPNIQVIREKGAWKGENQTKSQYTSCTQWHLEKEKRRIALSHMHFGENKPVFLCHLLSRGSGMYSETPHRCINDIYSLEVTLETNYLKMVWSIQGPKKNERIERQYF